MRASPDWQYDTAEAVEQARGEEEERKIGDVALNMCKGIRCQISSKMRAMRRASCGIDANALQPCCGSLAWPCLACLQAPVGPGVVRGCLGGASPALFRRDSHFEIHSYARIYMRAARAEQSMQLLIVYLIYFQLPTSRPVLDQTGLCIMY